MPEERIDTWSGGRYSYLADAVSALEEDLESYVGSVAFAQRKR